MTKNITQGITFDDALLQLDLYDTFTLERLKNREIYITDVIDNETIDLSIFRHHIAKWNREDEGIVINKRKPIMVYINSPGGDTSLGFSIIDIITASKTPVYTINIGMAYSMGYLIYLAGHKRYAYPHATYLMHDGESSIWNSSSKVRDTAKFLDKLEEKTKNYILFQTTMPEDEYDKCRREEVYMFNEDVISIGALDGVIKNINELISY